MTYEEAKDVFIHHADKYDNWKARSGIADGTFNGLLHKEYSLTEEQIQIVEKHFDNKNVLKILKDDKITLSDLTKKLQTYEDAIEAITDVDKANALRKLFESSSFTKLSDIDNIVKNINKIDGDALAKLSDKEICHQK